MSETEKIIDGKKRKIKIVKQIYDARADIKKNTILISEKSKNDLNTKELDSIYYHESEHFTFLNKLISFIPILIILFILYSLNKYLETIFAYVYALFILLTGIFIFYITCSIIMLPFMWLRELLCDCNAVKKTKGDIFRKTLIKFHDYNKRNSKPSLKRFYGGVVLHPPQPIRLWFIKKMEKRRDRKT